MIKKIDNVKHEKYTIKNKAYKNWKTMEQHTVLGVNIIQRIIGHKK